MENAKQIRIDVENYLLKEVFNAKREADGTTDDEHCEHFQTSDLWPFGYAIVDAIEYQDFNALQEAKEAFKQFLMTESYVKQHVRSDKTVKGYSFTDEHAVLHVDALVSLVSKELEVDLPVKGDGESTRKAQEMVERLEASDFIERLKADLTPEEVEFASGAMVRPIGFDGKKIKLVGDAYDKEQRKLGLEYRFRDVDLPEDVVRLGAELLEAIYDEKSKEGIESFIAWTVDPKREFLQHTNPPPHDARTALVLPLNIRLVLADVMKDQREQVGWDQFRVKEFDFTSAASRLLEHYLYPKELETTVEDTPNVSNRALSWAARAMIKTIENSLDEIEKESGKRTIAKIHGRDLPENWLEYCASRELAHFTVTGGSEHIEQAKKMINGALQQADEELSAGQRDGVAKEAILAAKRVMRFEEPKGTLDIKQVMANHAPHFDITKAKKPENTGL